MTGAAEGAGMLRGCRIGSLPEPDRYARQAVLPEVGPEGQERLRHARILCVGAGGLGSPAALYLAAAGVGAIRIIDPDVVDLSNLQRQILFGTPQQGAAKVVAAKERLHELNPEVVVEVLRESLTRVNALSAMRDCGLVIDGTDNFASRFLINDAAYKMNIPVVYGAITGFEGQAALFNGRGEPCYRCLHPKSPVTRVRNCAEAGVLGAVAGVVGSLQACIALNYIVAGNDPRHPLMPRVGRMAVLDLRTQTFNHFQVVKNPACPTCSQDPDTVPLPGDPPDACSAVPLVSPAELRDLLDRGTALLLDVRDEDEWAAGRIPGSVHWPLRRLRQGQLPKWGGPLNTRVVVCCRSGIRSAEAATILRDADFGLVESLAGGLNAWPGPWARVDT